MESEKLRHFCVTADCGSLTKAAEVLNISLGGLSKSIKSLEEELGFSLFVSAGRGLTPTDRGLLLYPKARHILDSVSGLKRADEPFCSIFRIGLLEVFSIDFVGAIISKKFSNQRVETIECGPGELEALVMEKKIDCAITYLPFPRKDLEFLKIGTFELRAFATRSLAARKSISEIPFIAPTTGLDSNPLGIRERDGWSDDSMERNKFYRTNMLSAALGMARRGLGAVYMPDFVAALHNETQIKEYHLVPVSNPGKIQRLKREVFLLKTSFVPESSEMKKLSAAIREQLK